MKEFAINLNPGEAAELLSRNIRGFIDKYVSQNGAHVCIVLVFEQYYFRNSSMASLTVTISNLSGRTVVHAVGSGSGAGMLGAMDWGAAKSFESEAAQTLAKYKI